jgi:hypothetical protein
MLNEIITIYAITDDILKAIGHQEDSRRQMNDAEIITTALTAAMFFYGNQSRAEVYADSAYTDYITEDDLQDSSEIVMKVMRKSNSHRQDQPCVQYLKQVTRHYIETVFSAITNSFPKSIHAVTFEGFLLKVQTFIFAFTFKQAFI